MLCLDGAAASEVREIGFELNVGDGPVVLRVVSLRCDAGDFSDKTGCPIATKEILALPEECGAGVQVFHVNADRIV